MASMLRNLITSNLLFTRSVSSYNSTKVNLRSTQIFNGFGITSNHRCYTTSSTPETAAANDQSSTREPIRFSHSLVKVKGKYFNFSIPGMEKTVSDDDEGLCVFLKMPGVKKKEDVKVSIKQDDLIARLDIEGKTHDQVSYSGAMYLLENFEETTSSDHFKGEIMQDGTFKLTLPMTKVMKHKQLETKTNNNIFADMVACFKRKFGGTLLSLPLVLKLIYQSCTFEEHCPEPLNSCSTTIVKDLTRKTYNISFTPGLEKMEFNSMGVCVSINMPELKIEDVKLYFRRDNFLFIRGKKKTETKKLRYITCIHLPENILKKRNMIKTEMQDGIYKATLLYKTVEIKIN